MQEVECSAPSRGVAAPRSQRVGGQRHGSLSRAARAPPSAASPLSKQTIRTQPLASEGKYCVVSTTSLEGGMRTDYGVLFHVLIQPPCHLKEEINRPPSSAFGNNNSSVRSQEHETEGR